MLWSALQVNLKGGIERISYSFHSQAASFRSFVHGSLKPLGGPFWLRHHLHNARRTWNGIKSTILAFSLHDVGRISMAVSETALYNSTTFKFWRHCVNAYCRQNCMLNAHYYPWCCCCCCFIYLYYDVSCDCPWKLNKLQYVGGGPKRHFFVPFSSSTGIV